MFGVLAIEQFRNCGFITGVPLEDSQCCTIRAGTTRLQYGVVRRYPASGNGDKPS